MALTFGAICIAFAAIFVRWAAVPGTVSAFYRVAIAAVLLSPWWAWSRASRTPRQGTWTALAAGVFFAADLALWNTAVMTTSAADATLLANAAPLWVALGAILLFRERLPRRFWVGMVISLIGVVSITAADALRHLRLGEGDLLALAASVAYAGYLLATQRARTSLDALNALLLSLVAGVAVLLPFTLAIGLPLWGYGTRTWLALLGLGAISQAGGWLAINYALGTIPATVTSVTLLGQPVLTALLAIPLLGEGLSTTQIAGGILVLAGIALVHQLRL